VNRHQQNRVASDVTQLNLHLPIDAAQAENIPGCMRMAASALDAPEIQAR
jgi:hypothetical protein